MVLNLDGGDNVSIEDGCDNVSIRDDCDNVFN